MKALVVALLLAGASFASAQVVPGAQLPQPGSPSQTQQPGDPTAMPATPPSFAPGTGPEEATPSHPRVIRISGGVMAGNLVSKVDPIYPEDARSAHISGTVVMSAHIGSDGRVKDLAVVAGPQLLQAAALDAVRQWVYKPYILNGQTVDVNTVITVNFNLR